MIQKNSYGPEVKKKRKKWRKEEQEKGEKGREYVDQLRMLLSDFFRVPRDVDSVRFRG